MSKQNDKQKMPENKEISYFICGTIGELAVENLGEGCCSFELIPDEEMKAIRGGRDGHIWMPQDLDKKGAGKAVVHDGKEVSIELNLNSKMAFDILLAAKVNSLRVRVEAKNVESKDGNPQAWGISLM